MKKTAGVSEPSRRHIRARKAFGVNFSRAVILDQHDGDQQANVLVYIRKLSCQQRNEEIGSRPALIAWYTYALSSAPDVIYFGKDFY